MVFGSVPNDSKMILAGGDVDKGGARASSAASSSHGALRDSLEVLQLKVGVLGS